jgi:hypothetical protein
VLAFCDEAIKRGGHGIDRLPVNVVLQDDGTRACPSEYPLGDRRSSRMFPIQGVHRPVNDIELKPLRDPNMFRFVKRTIRRPQQHRCDPARGADRVLSLFDLLIPLWGVAEMPFGDACPEPYLIAEFIPAEVSLRTESTVDFFVADLVLSQVTKNIRDVPRPFIRNCPEVGKLGAGSANGLQAGGLIVDEL